MNAPWYQLSNPETISSPALLVYPERVRENVRRMIALAGSVERLRPHIKTHKLAEVIRLQMEQGITKFKCATIAEAEMAASCGVPDVLLAYQPVGPTIQRLMRLVQAFPKSKFSVIADDAGVIRALSAAARREEHERQAPSPEIEVLLDLDIGQHRTGVAPGPGTLELYRLIASLPGLKPGGLHAYDGHIHDSDVEVRAGNCQAAFAPVEALRQELNEAGLPVPRVVAGGTPTLPMHSRRAEVECSPGTCLFWDAGYGTKLPDLVFLPAAVVFTRVVSKPTAQRLCLDLGHKAIASEMPHPRVQFLNLTEGTPVAHNEEHLVVETAHAAAFKVGDFVYGIPWHICPTVALHAEAVVVEDGKATQRWKIVARERRLTI
jgi:D-serine deaminase-like pyridoxal phosphate-dependent protein